MLTIRFGPKTYFSVPTTSFRAARKVRLFCSLERGKIKIRARYKKIKIKFESKTYFSVSMTSSRAMGKVRLFWSL